MPKVAVVMGSKSDGTVMQSAIDTLQEFQVELEVKILSAHRTPKETADFATTAASKGFEVIIAGAGYAAHLAGVIASYTRLPVIGVPIDSSPIGGLDALLATAMMPSGVPVATVTIGKSGARNAAILAIRILALKYPDLEHRLARYTEEMRRRIVEDL